MVYWWDRNKNTVMVLVMDVQPTGSFAHQGHQIRLPGGGNEAGEDPVATGIRELNEETGLRYVKKSDPVLIHSALIRDHQKNAFAVPRGTCKGKIRTKRLVENDGILGPPRPLTLNQAIDQVLYKPHNPFNRDALKRLKEHLRKTTCWII
jgi:ADP-ribose pyrophosphatase YjhB (NUDIX family)